MSDRTRKWHGPLRRRKRVITHMGYLYYPLRWLRLVRLAKWMMRRPWHVADELRPDGRWVKVMAYPKGRPRPRTLAMNEAAAQRAAELRAGAEPKPAATKLATIRLRPGMRLWQLVDGEVVEVQVLGTSRTRRANVNPMLPIVAALNAENAARKLGVNKQQRA